MIYDIMYTTILFFEGEFFMFLAGERLRRAAGALLTAFAVLFALVTASLPSLSAYAAGGSCGSSASWTLSG